MNKYLLPPLLLFTLGACCGKPLTVIPNCDYVGTPSLTGQKYAFVAPTFQQYSEGSGATQFYLEPSRENPLRHWSWRYSREFIDVKHKPVAMVAGDGEKWTQWLFEDCRVLYTLDE